MKWIALAVFVSLMIPSKPSFAEWFKVVAKSADGHTTYIDTKIRKHDGHIYYWHLIDYLKPFKTGTLSVKIYNEADCGKFRDRQLQYIFYAQPMGEGNGDSQKPEDQSWIYPSPGTVGAIALEAACKMAKNR
jgi:hypothetical protein